MSRLSWATAGSKIFELGIDRGVLYLESQPGVPWVGLTSVVENPSGGESKPFYIDGVKYLNLSAVEEFEATLTAYTYPDEFGVCDGTATVRSGLLVTQQRRQEFGFSYRTKVGNELAGPEYGYRIHLVYNALAAVSQRNYSTMGESNDPTDFSWAISTRPPLTAGYKRSAHIVIDSRDIDELTLTTVEDILYGNDEFESRLPTFQELIDVFDTALVFEITDLGDGTYRASAPNSLHAVTRLDFSSFEITWPTAVAIDADSFTVSS